MGKIAELIRRASEKLQVTSIVFRYRFVDDPVRTYIQMETCALKVMEIS